MSNQPKNDSKKKIRILVVGSGLASYGACLALINKKNIVIDVIDIGLKKAYKGQPNYEVPNSKDYKGSFFAYGMNDKRWDVKLKSKRICSSHAFGGYSKSYSGSILQPKNRDLEEWPLESKPNSSDYLKIVSSLNIKQKVDELNEAFPIDCKDANKENYEKTYLGSSRIAISEERDERGEVIIKPFDTSQIFEHWINMKKINYLNERYVNKIESIKNILFVEMECLKGIERRQYDLVFLGAGCVNTTAIVDRSLFKIGIRNYKIKSAPFLLQLHLQIGTSSNSNLNLFSGKDEYGLCKNFLEIKSKKTLNYWSHTQIGDLNRIIIKKVTNKIPQRFKLYAERILKKFKFSITVFHSRLGPEINLVSNIKEQNEQIIEIEEKEYICNQSLTYETKSAILSKFNQLKLIPIPFSQYLGDYFRKNKLGGWHFGGSLPMAEKPKKINECYSNGELKGIKGVFIIDSSAFPSIPGSSIALLSMANAYRITNNKLRDIL